MKRENLIFLLFITIASYFLFYNLSDIYLWQDEAETANVSQTILKDGIPKGYNGLNYFSQQQGGELGPHNEWKLHSWFHFYWQAAFFAMLGVSTFTARLPFALLGLASILLVYFTTKRIFKNKRAALIALTLLTFCIPFILLARQSRYYAAAMFFMVYSLFSYVLYLEKNENKYLIHLGTAMFLLFHSQYMFYFTFLFIIIAHSYFFNRQGLKKLLIPVIFTLILNLPFLYWLSGTVYSQKYYASSQLFSFDHFQAFIIPYVTFFFKYLFSPWLLLIPLILLLEFYVKGKKKFANHKLWSSLILLVSLLIFNLISLSLVSLELYFRYLAPLLPIAIILASLLIAETHRWHFILPWAIVLALIFSEPVFKFIQQLNSSYEGPIEAMVKYFDKNLQPDDTIVITYGDLPLKFYFPNHKIYGGLTGENLKKALNARWIIIRDNTISAANAKTFTYLVKHVNFENYQPILPKGVCDIPFENRESPFEHQYKSVRHQKPLRIFKRKNLRIPLNK